MTDQQIIEVVEKEFREKTSGVTQQYLQIHSPIYVDNRLKIERIDREGEDEFIVAYLPVAGERFYFAVYINSKTNAFAGIDTEANIMLYFTATSEILSADQLKEMTILEPTEFWSKGDLRKNVPSTYNFSRFKIFPNPEPDEFEDKLKKLLDLLERDREGIKKLVNNSESSIQVAMNIHNATGMIGGSILESNIIKRVSDLGLSVYFDLYVEGNKFED